MATSNEIRTYATTNQETENSFVVDKHGEIFAPPYEYLTIEEIENLLEFIDAIETEWGLDGGEYKLREKLKRMKEFQSTPDKE